MTARRQLVGAGSSRPARHSVGAGFSRPVLILRVVLGPNTSIGPGKVRLLEAIGRVGSISAAARSLGMSYRRAWLLVASMNRTMRKPVVKTSAGGLRGGGAGLTPFGRELVASYRRLERRARKTLHRELGGLGRMAV